MSWSILIPFCVGVAGILQGSINKSMSQGLGLSHALLIGNILVLAYSLILYFFSLKSPSLVPEMFHVKEKFTVFKWWWIIPSIFGMIIIVGIPFSIAKIGAAKSVIIIIMAQMLTSIIWDLTVEKLPLNTMKILGLLFALASAAFTILS